MKNYIKYIRRQSKHVQHVHAAVFSGAITFIIAAIILYTDYGFWHETYKRSKILTVEEMTNGQQGNEEPVSMQSPGAMVSSFFSEAKARFGTINNEESSFLESSKETYKREQ